MFKKKWSDFLSYISGSKLIRVVAILLFCLGIIRSIFPDYIKLPKMNFDGYVFILLVSSVIVWNIKYLKKIKLMLNKSNFLKASIVFLGIIVIVLRMFFEKIRFDNISLSILVLLVLILLIPNIQDLILRVKKIKKGDFELEWDEQIKELKENIEKVEEQQSDRKEDEIKQQIETQEVIPDVDYFIDSLKPYLDEPRIVLILIAIEIEKRVRNLAFDSGTEIIMSHRQALKEVVDKNILPTDILVLSDQFMRIRGFVVHGKDDELSNKDIYETANLGMRILNLLPTEDNK
ncbi:hypothetical protein [Paenibacillus xylanexedens]|uniref:hypothetical protein n=1 Tax=Paenibacillus xylanexedens TaxID=528191 RepID=UPI0011A8518D|nr:hypothetical protein [Paenibacillus xylanexedens]